MVEFMLLLASGKIGSINLITAAVTAGDACKREEKSNGFIKLFAVINGIFEEFKCKRGYFLFKRSLHIVIRDGLCGKH